MESTVYSPPRSPIPKPLFPGPRFFLPIPAPEHAVTLLAPAIFSRGDADGPILLGERCYPFGSLKVKTDGEDSSAAVAAIDWRQDGGGWNSVSLGSFPDLVEAARAIAFTPTQFGTVLFEIRITFPTGEVRYASTEAATFVRIAVPDKQRDLLAVAAPFAGAQIAADASLIDSVEYEISGAETVARAAVPRALKISGTATGPSDPTVLEDDDAGDFTVMARAADSLYPGDIVNNLTDGSTGRISSVTATQITVDALTGGTDNDFDPGDSYEVREGWDLAALAKHFRRVFANSGEHRVTLYATDTSMNESSASVVFRTA